MKTSKRLNKSCGRPKGLSRARKMAMAFIRDESGQSTTEYVLLLVVVVFIIKQVKQQMGDRLKSLLDTAFKQAETEIQSN